MALWHVRTFTVFKVTDACFVCAEERMKLMPQTYPDMIISVEVDEIQYEGGENKLCTRHKDEL